jgi:hypothetical protein
LSKSYLSLRFFPLAKIIERMENKKFMIFGHSDGVQR